MKNVLVLLLIAFVLSACNQQEEIPDKSELEKQEGIVALKRERNAGRPNDQFLLIPNITAEDIASKTKKEIVTMAQEKNGAYYGVSTDEYDEIEIGTKVVVYWGNGQEDSIPPQRIASIIEKVSK